MVQLSSSAFTACTVLTLSCLPAGSWGSDWAASPALAALDSLPGIPATIPVLVSQEQLCCWRLICTEPAEVLDSALFPLQCHSWTQPRVKTVEQLFLFLNVSEVILFRTLNMFKLHFCLCQSKKRHFLFGNCCIEWFCLCSLSKCFRNILLLHGL